MARISRDLSNTLERRQCEGQTIVSLFSACSMFPNFFCMLTVQVANVLGEKLTEQMLLTTFEDFLSDLDDVKGMKFNILLLS